MELLRHVVVLMHIVGFAVTFGAWAAEGGRPQVPHHPVDGLRTARVTAHRSGAGRAVARRNCLELSQDRGVKLAILVVIGGLLGMGNARQRRTGEPVPRPVFFSVGGVLSLAAASIAVLW